MTKKMLEDYIKILNKQKKFLLIALIVVSVLFVGTAIFAFSEFEVSQETETKYEIEYEAETGDGNNAVIKQINDMSNTENSDNIVYICVTAFACILIICLTVAGIILYVKIKNENYKDNKKEIKNKKKEQDS